MQPSGFINSRAGVAVIKGGGWKERGHFKRASSVVPAESAGRDYLYDDTYKLINRHLNKATTITLTFIAALTPLPAHIRRITYSLQREIQTPIRGCKNI